MKFLVQILGSLFCFLTACKKPTSEGVYVVSVTEFAEVVKKEDVLLIDVRTPEEYQKGYIDKAINIDFYQSNFKENLSKLDSNLPVAVYCKRGGRSAKAAQVLHDLGFTTIYDLDGGYTQWKNEYHK